VIAISDAYLKTVMDKVHNMQCQRPNFRRVDTITGNQMTMLEIKDTVTKWKILLIGSLVYLVMSKFKVRSK
jgi:hypothetical protein